MKRHCGERFGFNVLLIFISLFLVTDCKKKEEATIHINLPAVTTLAPVDIAVTSASVGGTISSYGGGTISQKGVCYSTQPDPGISDSIISVQDTNTTFTCKITGLNPNTTYYVKAFAGNSAGISYGNQVSFKTLKLITLPIVITYSMTGITRDSATGGGDVTNDGGAPVTAKGVCWSTFQLPIVSDNHTNDGSDTGSFTSKITGLTMRTTYYVRAYAMNSAGTNYGNQVSFITPDSTISLPCPGLPSITYEGKIYHTILIGTQCWLKENLNTGTQINGIQDQDPTNGQIEKYCYDDSESNCDTYGGLYQWAEMMQGSTNPGTQGICPGNWHIPNDSEWTLLTSYLGSENVAGGKMKSNTGWYNGGNSSNSSGFTAVPGGLRYYDGRFAHLGDFAYFWSSQSYDSTQAWYRNLTYANTIVYRNFDKNILGYSVRCIKD